MTFREDIGGGNARRVNSLVDIAVRGTPVTTITGGLATYAAETDEAGNPRYRTFLVNSPWESRLFLNRIAWNSFLVGRYVVEPHYSITGKGKEMIVTIEPLAAEKQDHVKDEITREIGEKLGTAPTIHFYSGYFPHL